ncbi:MAG: hypothetical protein AABW50_02235 [Nanoarchaeota archaeon]
MRRLYIGKGKYITAKDVPLCRASAEEFGRYITSKDGKKDIAEAIRTAREVTDKLREYRKISLEEWRKPLTI